MLALARQICGFRRPEKIEPVPATLVVRASPPNPVLSLGIWEMSFSLVIPPAGTLEATSRELV